MIKKILLTISLLTIFAGAFAQMVEQNSPTYDLKYQFTKGDQYQIKLHTQQDSYLTVNGERDRTTNLRDAQLLFTIKEINHLNATIEAYYQNIILVSSSGDDHISVNTETNDDGMYNRLFKALIGQKFTIILQNDGTVKSVSDMGKIFDKMIAAVPEVKKDEKVTLKGFLNNQFGAESIKANLALVFPHYPVRTVQTNGSWSSLLYTDGFYHGRINNYWKLEFGDKYALRIKNTGKLVTDSSEQVDLGGGNKGFVDLKGDVEGQYMIDTKTYWPTSCIIHTELGGSYIYLNPKRRKKNIVVPVRVVMDASYKFKHL